MSRARLLQQLADSRNTPESVEKVVTEYLALLQGLCEDVTPQTTADGTPLTEEAKLQKVETFKWTNTICGSTATYVKISSFFFLFIFLSFCGYCCGFSDFYRINII